MPLTKTYTTESILTALGYPDPLMAACQHARLILLGRLARYQVAIQQLETRWGCSLTELRARYQAKNQEDFVADDDYLTWQWYSEAVDTVKLQLAVVSKGNSHAPVI